ncbi:MAG TPA: NUDIX domain-containing protein [Bellilinea sp.]|nr:NUDIX domain-containing protein [Bellilinea sp.]
MDISFRTGEGRFNFRVGAIIIQDNQILMVRNFRDPYYYSVGGRVHLHESLEEAVLREVLEETGVPLEIEKLGFIHENFFTLEHSGEVFHEISFFYYMKPVANFLQINASLTEDGIEEKLEWIPLDKINEYALYPEFFKTDLYSGLDQVQHFVTRD